ncbi:MAG: PqqD family protein [Sphingomonadales bacterium]|nr:PqqD family protein [Sphingomonadales bacterium]
MTGVLAKRGDAFSETTIDDEVVLLNLADGTFFSLTGTAARIWGLIDGTRDRAALLADLAAAYGVPTAAIAPDVEAFLAQLGEAGFLERG